ncbi:MAG TPA: alpha/beta hydrolase [Steroidobacteraceae bacterium]|nr:alpha/beta hydrolase [Steroidobacteraceae bacterium]
MAGFHGTDLVGDEVIPAGARAGLLIVHGMAEHRGRYVDAVQRLTRQGLACFTFDLRGHGDSPGDRADIDSFQVFVDDLQAIRAGIARSHSGLPLFIWAHSLGTIVAIRGVEQDGERLRGVITSGCPLAAFQRVPAPLRSVLKALCTPFSPLRVSPGLAAEQLSHSREVQQRYVADPRIPGKVTVRLLMELESACRAALDQAHTITVPWLALHGGADDIAPPQGSKQLVDALGSRDKTVELFAGMRHEVHNEIEPTPTEFYARMLHWMEARLV